MPINLLNKSHQNLSPNIFNPKTAINHSMSRRQRAQGNILIIKEAQHVFYSFLCANLSNLRIIFIKNYLCGLLKCIFRVNGGGRDRTGDLLVANETLSQLSYTPYKKSEQ